MRFLRILPLMALLFALNACSLLDVVASDAVRAFDEVLDSLPATGSAEEGGWVLTAPDGAARLIIGIDHMALWADAQPFIDAGLDLSKLPDQNPESLVFLTPAFDMLNMNVKDSAKKQFASNLRPLRKYLGYHGAMDHYNLEFDEGNLFEWAKNMQKNSVSGEEQLKDIVFVLNPGPLIEAGLDPNAVVGWAYAAVPVEADGRMSEVWKLLKPFDLGP
ncbi:MAG: hypothetical protein LBU47_07970 [Christensenellaceae bacterium]|jgi:hypothetical protein|nr:hypothetical protein [Christensenellaceae bacterium]